MSGGIGLVLGTRPEIIKLAPVIHACERRDLPYTVIHTGQHYSDSLDSVFFDQLSLPDPDYHLDVGSAEHGAQTGEMIIGVEQILRDHSLETVLVQGDTNSVLAGAIAASKLDTELGHVEAGLRSFDRKMPEELNRVLTDHAADTLFAPTAQSKQNLITEGIPASRITVTGNTVVDALQHNRSVARETSSVLNDYGLEPGEYFLLTLHRQENVDDEDLFQSLLTGAARGANEHDVPVIYPIHPRAKKRLTEFGLTVPDSIRIIEPQEYLDFLRLEDEATLILTDSGGVQEEACILGTPCVTLRETTERPETVSVGANVLSSADPDAIRKRSQEMIEAAGEWHNPFGDGDAASRIVETVTDRKEGVQL